MAAMLLALLLGAQGGSLVLDREASAVTWLRSPSSGRVLIAGTGEIRGGVLRGPGRVDADAADLYAAEQTADGQVTVTGACADRAPGVMGLALALRGIPDDLEAIVPATSGLHFTAETALSEFRAEWPISWEAGFLVFQGQGEGLLVMSDDRDLTFKALVLKHREGYWDVLLESHNQAPFADQTAHTAPPWLLIPYEGDWRVAARRYRELIASRHDLGAALAAQPAWAHEIRLCVLLPVDETLLDPLAERCDPAQTLLYLPDWRTFGYDRNYPEYTARPEVKPFIDHAHRLGFRVMPHANYFGLDPLHPLYAKYEQYQLRDRDTGEKLWWDWTRADPPIKFAYIHPGCAEWRKELIGRIAQSYRELGFDALHIDQTLCIFNHAGGLVDGLNCARGNLVFHEELRKALPEVALSGEGLDEVTFVEEAFAQRHVWGIDHSNGRWYRDQIDLAHPISSYLFTPHTTIYGYLGMASPSSDQLYSAWRQAYRWLNVIPTIAWPGAEALARPAGFWDLAFREANAWQQSRLLPDPDAEWPEGVCYPYRTADGRRAEYRDDSGTTFSVGGEEVTRVVSGVTSLRMPGGIAGWRYYDAQETRGLDPSHWYAYDPTPRRMDVLHVEEAPADATVAVNEPATALGRIVVTDLAARLDLAALLRTAECSVTLQDGTTVRQTGRLEPLEAMGALVRSASDVIEFHPAWQALPDGTGARGAPSVAYQLELPASAHCEFRARGYVEPNAGDKTDGVDFTVTAVSPIGQAEVTIHADAMGSSELRLDLTPIAGSAVTLTIVCDDGPEDNPSFDWARLAQPTVYIQRDALATLRVAGVDQPFVTPEVAEPIVGQPGEFAARCPYGGAVYLGDATATPVGAMPLDLLAVPWTVTFRQPDGSDRTDPGPYAGLTRGAGVCGGEEREALHTHPPNEGQTVLQAVLTLPAQPARLRAEVGLRAGSKSDGVDMAIWAGGTPRATLRLLPDGGWQPLSVDLSDLAGRTTVVELVTDSAGPFTFDWAMWSRVRIEAR